MSLVFVDTGAWIALSRERDPHHQRARAFYRGLRRADRLLTTNYVLTETYTWLRYRSTLVEALDLHQVIGAAVRVGTLRVDWVSPELHDLGWNLFVGYRDQVLSLTDCTSAVVARESGADYVFSFDSDFSILGFDVRPSS